jgi:hypothetical protein
VDLNNLMNGRYVMNTNSVAASASSKDDETYWHADGDYALNWGGLTTLKVRRARQRPRALVRGRSRPA